jgi:POT family proton-dependent oligopeptide transporter
VNYGVYPFLARFFDVTPLRRIGIGLGITAVSFLVIAYIQSMIDAGGKPSLWWQMLAYVILTLGEVMVSITALEFSYTQAPNKMKSASWPRILFSVSLGNQFTAQVNRFIMDPATGPADDERLQLLHVLRHLMGVATLIFAIVARFYRYKTYLQTQDEPMDEVEAVAPTLGGGAPT